MHHSHRLNLMAPACVAAAVVVSLCAGGYAGDLVLDLAFRPKVADRCGQSVQRGGALTQATGRDGGPALTFNAAGSDGCLSVPGHKTSFPTESFTISTRIRLASLKHARSGSNWYSGAICCTKYGGTLKQTGFVFHLYGAEGSQLALILSDGERQPTYLGRRQLRTDRWYDLAVSVDREDGRVRFFIDGFLDNDLPLGELGPTPSFRSLFIGNVDSKAVLPGFTLRAAMDRFTISRGARPSPLAAKRASPAYAAFLRPDLLNVATAGHEATAAASAKMRRRYLHGPDAIIDGDPNTYWNAGDPGPQWVQVSWRFPRYVNKVAFDERIPDTVAGYRVLGKIEGAISSRWQVLAEGSATQPVTTASFPLTPVKSLRIELTPRLDDMVLELAEVKGYTVPERLPAPLRWQAQWIWLTHGSRSGYSYRDATAGHRYFRRGFDVADPRSVRGARVVLAVNQSAKVYVNGRQVAAITSASREPDVLVDFRNPLRRGRNVIAVDAYFSGAPGWPGFMAQAVVERPGQGPLEIRTDAAWRASREMQPKWAEPEFDDSAWQPAEIMCDAYGAPGHLQVRRSRNPVYVPPGSQETVRLTGLRVPNPVQPGQWVQATAVLTPERRLRRDYGFFLQAGWDPLMPIEDYRLLRAFARPAQPTSEWTPGATATVAFRVWVPEYAPPGFAFGLRIHGSDGQARLAVDGDPPAFETAAARPRPGRPRGRIGLVRSGKRMLIEAGGERLSGRHVCLRAKRFENFYNMAQAGYRIFEVGSYPQYLLDIPENEDANLDRCFRIIDRQCRCMMAYARDPWLMVSLIYRGTPAFIERYREECTQLPNGRVLRPSPASRLVRDACFRVTRKLLAKMESQPYRDRILGYELHGFEDGTFRWWGYNRGAWAARSDVLIPLDVSTPGRREFEQWTKARYAGPEAIRSAWGSYDPASPFGPVDAAMRRDYGAALRDPARCRPSTDYFDFRHDTVLALRTGLARWIKDSRGGNVIVQTHSTFPGYGIFGPCAPLVGNGHQPKLCAAPAIDSLGQNHSYNFRRRERHYGPQALYSSLQLHDKVVWSELDNRTFLSSLADYKEYSLRGSVEIERLHLGADLCLGMTERRLAFDSATRGQASVLWTGCPELHRELSSASRLDEFAAREPWAADAEIAVLVSTRDVYFMDLLTPGPTFGRMYGVLQNTLNLLPAGYDLYFMDDVGHPLVQKRYKLYIFLSADVLSPAQVSAIERLKTGGKTLLWFWAPGYVDERVGLQPQRVEQLVGMDLHVDPAPVVGEIVLAPDSPLAKDSAIERFRVPRAYAHRKWFQPKVAPHFYVTDPSARGAGRFAHNGQVGLAVKQRKEWTSVFCGIPYMPEPVLRSVAKLAGVHLYVDEPDVYVKGCREWIVLHSLSSRSRAVPVRLRRPSRAYDVFAKQPLPVRSNQVRLPVGPYETKLLYLGAGPIDALAQSMAW